MYGALVFVLHPSDTSPCEEPIKLNAVGALHTQGTLDPQFANAVGSALLDVDEDVRELAALTLLHADEASLAYKKRLMGTAVNDKVAHVQAAAVHVLEALSGQLAANDFAAELASGLASEDVSGRWGALKALRALGLDAVEPYSRDLALLLSLMAFHVQTALTMDQRTNMPSLKPGRRSFSGRGFTFTSPRRSQACGEHVAPGLVSRWSLVAMARTKGDAGRRGTGRGRSRGGVQKRPARALEVDDDDEADEAEASAEKSKSLDPNQIQNRLESYETVENRLDVEPKTEDVAKVVKVDAAASLAVPTASSAANPPSARSAPSAPSPRRSRSQHVDETNDTHDANDADANVQSEAESESSGSSASRSELDEEMLGDLPYLVDNESGVFFTLRSAERRSRSSASSASRIHAFRWPGHFVWSQRLRGPIEKSAMGQGFVAFASRQSVHILSSAGGFPIFPPLVLEQPLLQMRIQHGFLLLLSLDGEVKVLDLSKRLCITKASLKDICEPSLLQLDQDALQLNASGQISLRTQSQELRFDNSFQLWMDTAQQCKALASQETGRRVDYRSALLTLPFRIVSMAMEEWESEIETMMWAWKEIRTRAVQNQNEHPVNHRESMDRRCHQRRSDVHRDRDDSDSEQEEPMTDFKTHAKSGRGDDSWYVRTLATEMLLELGPRGAASSQPVLVKTLHSLDSEVRRTSAIALGRHGEVASPHAASLCTRMLANRPGVKSDDPDADLSERIDVKTACMWALGQLNPDSVVPLLHNLDDGLFHRNTEYRLAATEALTKLGPKAVALRKDQLSTMESNDRDDRVWVPQSDDKG
eukprot:symbB.v1.2.013587.t3/scaffold964.1/size148446/3